MQYLSEAASVSEVYLCISNSRNHSAENLYGWKDYEVIGRRVDEILVAEEHFPSLQNIMEKLRFGQSWSGQFPLKKRSGEIFMAMVTKSPLYEGGELAGVITVSSDAALFNGISLDRSRANEEHANGLPKSRGLNLKKIQWQPRPQIAPIPQIASSVSNLVLTHSMSYFLTFFQFSFPLYQLPLYYYFWKFLKLGDS